MDPKGVALLMGMSVNFSGGGGKMYGEYVIVTD
jgi:hypothetical protein